ncbi:MAG: hypothetical protein ABJE95_26025 [Byssovorax sp.]
MRSLLRIRTQRLSFALLAISAIACGSTPAAAPPPQLAVLPPTPSPSASASPAPPDLAPPDKLLADAPVDTPEAAIKAFRAYRSDRPETETRTRDAARFVARTHLLAARGPLLDVFLSLRVSTLKRVTELYRDVGDAMLAVPDPAWIPQLTERLTHPIVDRNNVPALRDEIFWQSLAAQILGDLQASTAVRPLISIVLSPAKIDIARTAVNSLIKIGKPAVAPAIALLRSEDAELVAYSTGESLRSANPQGHGTTSAQALAEKAHVAAAALILGAIGREECAPALIDALAKSDSISRPALARQLVELPRTPALEKAFQVAFEKVPLTQTLPPWTGASEALLDASASFFDPALVPWMVKSALALKGESDDIVPVQEAALQTVLKLMRRDQAAQVAKLLRVKTLDSDSHATTLEKVYAKELSLARGVLDACKDDVDCYVGKLVDPASQAESTQFQGIKAAYMVGALGGPETRQKLLDSLPKITNAAIRYLVGLALDHLSPRGDMALAASLQAIVDSAVAAGDQQQIIRNAPFKTVIYRLRARTP